GDANDRQAGDSPLVVRQRVRLLLPRRRSLQLHRRSRHLKAKQGLADIDPRGKRVLVRVDFNVPQDEAGRITDDRRIEAALPTIRHLLDRDAKVILVSHLGRPKGVDPKWTLKPVAERLSELLGRPVRLAPDSTGPEA